MRNNGKVDWDALAGVCLIMVIYLVGIWGGYLSGYRNGKDDCPSGWYEDGTITNFYVNIYPIPGE